MHFNLWSIAIFHILIIANVPLFFSVFFLLENNKLIIAKQLLISSLFFGPKTKNNNSGIEEIIRVDSFSLLSLCSFIVLVSKFYGLD